MIRLISPFLLTAFALGLPLASAISESDLSPPGWLSVVPDNSDGERYSEPITGNSNRGGAETISEDQSSIVETPNLGKSSTKGISSGFTTSSITASSDADYRTPELVTLAAGLKNDRLLIFRWVRDNIRYVHYHGCKKGAYLTYLEKSGNDADQTALLIALWRAAGIDCRYVKGWIEMPHTAANQIDWYHYFGVEASQLYDYADIRGTPYGEFGVRPGQPATTKFLVRFWAQVNVGGSWLNFDPSLKLIEPETGIDLGAATGYTRADLLTSLGTGVTGTNSITGLSYSGLDTYVSARVTQFLNTYRNTYFNKNFTQIVGGWKSLYNPIVNTSSFPILSANYAWGVAQTYDDFPSDYYATIQIKAPSVSLDWVGPGGVPVTTAGLRGRRLSLVFENNKATIKLDDTTVAQAVGTTTANASVSATVTITHAHSSSAAPGYQLFQSSSMDFKNGSSYALIYGFDVASEYLKSRQKQLIAYRDQGLVDTDASLKLETLNVIGVQWLLQTQMNFDLVANMKKFSLAYLHRFGIVAQEKTNQGNDSMYINVTMNYSALAARVPDPGSVNRRIATETANYMASAMEHGVLEQTQPAITAALSTMKVVKLANGASPPIPIFLANGSNYTAGASPIRPQLTGYGSLSTIDTAISDGGEALIPKSGQVNLNQWTGNGYLYSVWTSTLARGGLMIGGIYSGGYNSTYSTTQSNPIVNQSNVSNIHQKNPVVLPPTLGGDPVDLATGDFTHSRQLLTAGDGLVRGLNLSASYHGGRRTKNDAKLGYGWTHSYYVRASEWSDVDSAYGLSTPIEAASSIVGAYIAADVYANRVGVKDWVATALIANWTVDQLKGNAVSIVSGDRIWQFNKQGANTYNSPPGSTITLIKNAQGRYEATERHGPTWRFDASNRLQEIEDLWTKKLTFTYNGNGDLGTVADPFGRTLTFTYAGTGGALSSVADNGSPARSVTFTVNASGNLTSLSDPEGKADNFTYGTAHLLTIYKAHNNGGIVGNTYDDAGHVIEQDTMMDTTKKWHYYYAPGVTVVTEPAGAQVAETTHYFDDRNREIRVVNALGHVSYTNYDAQNRVTGRERWVDDGTGSWPVADVEYYTYDSSHNLRTITDAQSKVEIRDYDPATNELLSIKDKRGHFTYFQDYNQQHQPKQLTDREGRIVNYTYKPAADPGAGLIATMVEGGFTTSYGYDSRGALSSITYPGGASEGRTNNFWGDPTTITDPLVRSTTIGYNKRREVTSTIAPGTPTSGSRTTIVTYDDQRNVGSIVNPRGFTTSFGYSLTRKLLTTSLGNFVLVTNHYDSRDNVDGASYPLNQTTYFHYDALNRATSVTDPLSRTTSTIYQDAQRRAVVQSPAPLNYQYKVTLDSRGQVVRDENGLGQYAVPGYDNNGNQTSWQDRRFKTWGFTYDNEDRPLNLTSPLNRTTIRGWNPRGLLGTITEPSTQVTTFGYDGRRRLTSKADAVGTVDYGLDAASQLETVTEGSAVLTRTYHPSGDVATYKNASNETIGYDYDRNGNLVKLTYPAIGSVPSMTVTYTYDALDRLTAITEGTRLTTYDRDVAGRLVQVTRPNGTTRRMRWDAAGQLLGFEERASLAVAPLVVRSFVYDAAGRITKRLSYPQGQPWKEPALNAGVDDDNRLTGGILSYDADGNTQASLLPDGPWGAAGSSTNASATFGWNARNQLTSATRSAGGNAAYTYDAEGNLIQSTSSYQGTTRWIIDPDGGERPRVLAKVTGGQVTRYVYGIGLVYEIRQDGSVRYYHYDQIGSTVALTDQAGQIKGSTDYSPYGTLQNGSGELANANITPFLWVGAYGVITDPVTGLHQMRARWYSSYLHRFLSEDPIAFAGGENFYAYADGNPITGIDPDGEFAQLIWGAVIGVGVQAAIDLATGHQSSLGTYLGAAAGGALTGGISSLGRGVAIAAASGLVGGTTSSVTRQIVDTGSVNASSVAVESLTGGIGGGVGAKVLPGALRTLSNQTKGWIGEAASLVNNVTRGNLPAGGRGVGWQVEMAAGGRRPIWDWQFKNVFTGTASIVESKFGTAGLTSAQRAGAASVSNLTVEKWTYGFWSQAGGTVGGILGSTDGRK